MEKNEEKATVGYCQITKKEYPLAQLIACESVNPQLIRLMQEKCKNWDMKGYIAIHEISKFRNEYVQNLLETEKGELEHLETTLKNLRKTELLAQKSKLKEDENLSFGDRLADKIAEFGGSWKFIIIFFIVLAIWMGINSLLLLQKAFDPYPYILLNLILSCVAALQAPLIMMSQNRQEDKDRARAQHDYQVNMKAEMEIRQLHEKIDHVLIHQGQRLLQIQQVQIEMMQELLLSKMEN